MLKDEFRRHHARRRRNRIAQLSLLAVCLVASVVFSIILSRPRPSTTRAVHEILPTAPPSQSISTGLPAVIRTEHFGGPLTDPNNSRHDCKGGRAQPSVETRSRKASVTIEADRFVTLPTFDPAIPIDHLEMVRVDLPGRALRLVGFPVSEEIAERRVVADILLAQDGTPYALRLVQSSETKEQ